jgi:threonine/homoserine/homoserine lactone efflux protein
MEQIITFLTANKLILAGAVIVSILIILSVAKKLLKIAVVLLAVVVLYAAYLVYSGQKVPRTKQEVIEHSEKKLQELEKSGVKAVRGVK